MKKNYKAVILDLDNTLYPYDLNHANAMTEVENYCLDKLNISREAFASAFAHARKHTHLNLANTAASHNRFLYFQRLLETLQIPSVKHSLVLYDLYWDTFFEGMELSVGVQKTLISWNERGIKICLLTDLTARLQFRKIQKLGLDNYLDFIVTSEEVGHEKPHPYAFQSALIKLNHKTEDTIVIGDNWKKDILGARNLGIDAIWLTENDDSFDEIDNIHVFKCNLFSNIMLNVNE